MRAKEKCDTPTAPRMQVGGSRICRMAKGSRTGSAGARTRASGWKSNLQDGQGKQNWISGSTYEGEWKEGQQHGHGVYTLAGTTTGFNVYEGQWERGRKEGRGKLTISKKNAVLEEYDGE